MFDERKYKAEYYNKNKEKYRELYKKRYLEKGEQIRARRKELLKNETPERKEKRLQYHKNYNANPDHKQKLKARSQTPEHRYQHYYLVGAQRRGHSFELSYDEFLVLHNAPCAYCGDTESYGIDRVDNSAGYTKENCVPCCTVCNHMKWGYTKDKFIAQAQKIAQHSRVV